MLGLHASSLCPHSNRSPFRPCRRPALRSAKRGILGIKGIQSPADIDAWTNDVLKHHVQQPGNTPAALAHQPQQQQQQQQQQQHYLQAACSPLQFLAECHPDSSWQHAAREALQQLSAAAVYLQTAAAAATSPTGEQHGVDAQPSSSTTGSRPSDPHAQAARAAEAAVQQLAAQAGQLGDWVGEFRELQAAAAAAAAAIQHDPACSPLLLLDAAAAQQHPLWARDYAAFASPPAPPPAAAAGSAGAPPPQQLSDVRAASLLPFMPPAEQQLQVGIASLSIQHHYRAAAAATAGVAASSAAVDRSSGSSSSPAGSAEVCEGSASAPVMSWPLTAAGTQMLLCSPLGVLPGASLAQVYCLGLLGRCMALAEAADLARLVGQELQAAQAEQRELGQQLMQQLEQLHRAVQAGVAVDPVVLAASAGAAASTAPGLTPPHAAAAVGHPAVAASFLQDLAAFGKGAAAEEVQSWLRLCQSDPGLRSYLAASGALQQLPADASGLQPHQVDALREAVALCVSDRGTGGTRSAGAAAASSAGQEWLQEYTHLDTLLPGICSVLGDCLQLQLECVPAEPGSTWCEEAYVITCSEHPKQARTASFSSSSGQQQRRGCIWLLFDEQYHGMPATHMVSPGTPAAPAPAPAAASAAAAGRPAGRQPGASPTGGLPAQGGLQATTVAVVFPNSFCTASRQPAGSGDSSSGNSGSSSFSVLQGVLHELGHALHFLLSASGSAAPAVAGGQCSSLEVMEAASHLVERMARNSTCLQAMLRHHTTRQPPPPTLTQQLVAYNSISSRGVYQWHQHVLAALTDARMAAAAAAAAATGEGAAACWDCLVDVTRTYSPLQAAPELHAAAGTQAPPSNGSAAPAGPPALSSAMLQHLPALAVLQAGDMYCYVCADLIAAALWAKYLQQDPLDPTAWQVLRQGLFEADARQTGTVGVVEGLLGPGSMWELTVVVCSGQGGGAHRGGGLGGNRVSGWVPDVEHPSFGDIDLWG